MPIKKIHDDSFTRNIMKVLMLAVVQLLYNETSHGTGATT